MTTLEAGLWFLGCWLAAGVVAAWVWVSLGGFHPKLDKELREDDSTLRLTGWRR